MVQTGWAASASPSCSAALIWGTPVHRGASGSELWPIKTRQLLALHPSLPSPAGLGISNKQPLCMDPLASPHLTSSNSERRCCLSISCSVTCSTASWGGMEGGVLWKPGLQRNCCSCYWNPLSDFCSWSRKFAHGEGAAFASCRLQLPRQIPKASFLCGLFQNLLNVPRDLFLDNFFLPCLGSGQKRAEQMLDLKLSQFNHLTAGRLICRDVNERSLSLSHSGKRRASKKAGDVPSSRKTTWKNSDWSQLHFCLLEY